MSTAPTPGPRPPQSKAEYAYDVLREEILRTEIAGGSSLRAAAVAERLGVSITPVREALRRLENDGLITYQAHRGATVVDLSDEATEEFYGVRAVVEGLGASLAAARITSEDLAGLRGVHAEMVAAADAGDADADVLAALSEQLHLRIVDIGGPAFLGRQARAIRNAFPVPRGASLWQDPVLTRRHLQAHAALLDALAAVDADAAGRIMTDHVRESATFRLGDAGGA